MEIYVDENGVAWDDEGNSWQTNASEGCYSGRQWNARHHRSASRSSSVVKTFESSSNPGKVYTVRRIGGKLVCDCSGYRYRKTCSHVKSL